MLHDRGLYVVLLMDNIDFVYDSKLIFKDKSQFWTLLLIYYNPFLFFLVEQLIAWKEGANKLLVEPEEIKCLSRVSSLNPEAGSIYDLYPDPSLIFEPGSVWKDIYLSPSRPSIQLELKSAIKKLEEYNKSNGN